MKMMKAVNKLKFWSSSKKKRKFLEEPYYPVPTHHCCCCSCPSVQASAPPLPPWPNVDEGITISRSWYQQYMVENPVYDMPQPVVKITRRERSFGCVVLHLGSRLIRCFCPCFSIEKVSSLIS